MNGAAFFSFRHELRVQNVYEIYHRKDLTIDRCLCHKTFYDHNLQFYDAKLECFTLLKAPLQ